MAHRSVIICDYCGVEEDVKGFYDIHDHAEGRPPPKFVVIEVRAYQNDGNKRFIRRLPPQKVVERTGMGLASTNGAIRLELCLDCARKPLFDSLDIWDGEQESKKGEAPA